MRIVFLSNTRSGRGLSRWAARTIPGALRAAGHDVVERAVGEGRVREALPGAGAFVIVGGDGTIHRAAPDAIATGVPIYHIPCGNENLFARQFGMDRRLPALLAALADNRILRIDAARVIDDHAPTASSELEPVISLLMCSVGPDAGVIRRLTALRTRAIGHIAYVEPIVRECLHPSLPPLSVEIDGRRVIDAARGVLLVANSRQYALRIDPACRADMTDGLLDIVFLPAKSPVRLLLWGLRCRLRRPMERSGATYQTGREVRITSPEAAPYQIDGDSPGWRGAGQSASGPMSTASWGPLSLRLSIMPSALPVLIPRSPNP